MRIATLALVATGLACGGRTSDPCDASAAGAPWIAFSSREGAGYGISLLRADGTCLYRLPGGAGDELYPAWTPDGRSVTSTSIGDGPMHLVVHDLATGGASSIDVGALSATSAAYSRAGALAFEGRTDGQVTSDIFVRPPGTRELVQVTSDPSANGGPAWAPDGDTIFFVSNRAGSWDVYRASASGAPGTERVTTRSRIVGKPAVSPDGALLAYGRTVAGSSGTEVVTLTLATGDVRVVSSLDDSEPSFSPSGRELVVRSYRTGCTELFLLEAASGSVVRQLTRDCAPKGVPAFAAGP